GRLAPNRKCRRPGPHQPSKGRACCTCRPREAFPSVDTPSPSSFHDVPGAKKSRASLLLTPRMRKGPPATSRGAPLAHPPRAFVRRHRSCVSHLPVYLSRRFEAAHAQAGVPHRRKRLRIPHVSLLGLVNRGEGTKSYWTRIEQSNAHSALGRARLVAERRRKVLRACHEVARRERRLIEVRERNVQRPHGRAAGGVKRMHSCRIAWAAAIHHEREGDACAEWLVSSQVHFLHT